MGMKVCVCVYVCVCLSMHVCVGGSGGVWSQTGQSQQEGLDLDMVVKFHWLKGGLLHWLLSVELIIHMVGGEEWWGNPPQQKKKKRKKNPRTWPLESRLGSSGSSVSDLIYAPTPEWWRRPSFLQPDGFKDNIHTSLEPFHRWLDFTCSLCQYRILFSRRIIVIKATVKSSFSDGHQPHWGSLPLSKCLAVFWE